MLRMLSHRARTRCTLVNNRYVQITLNKVAQCRQSGDFKLALDLLSEVMELFPGDQQLLQMQGMLIADTVKAAEALQGQGQLDDAVRLVLNLAAVEPENRPVAASLKNALVRQIWQDQRAACLREVLRLGRRDLLPAPQDMQRLSDETVLGMARFFLGRGGTFLADSLCNYLADRDVTCPELHRLRALVHDLLTPAMSGKLPQTASKFLLIKSWGTGFWSDVDNLIGNLLLAEMTGRTPVVDWGANCLFSDNPSENAFVQFFEPLNSVEAQHLAGGAYSIYPPTWLKENLTSCDVSTLSETYARLPGLHYLTRSEDVLVSDYFVAVNELAPWIGPDHHLFGLTVDELYRTLFRKHLRLKPEIWTEIETFWDSRLAGIKLLAVHVRGSDKVTEDVNLPIINQLYHVEIDAFLQCSPDARIFLITDSTPVADHFISYYGNRVITTPCRRTSSRQGIHFQRTDSKRMLGVEVLRDVFLAIRCHSFLGYGLSSVSSAVAYLKDWAPGHCRLLGAKSTHMRRLTYYNDAPAERYGTK